MTFFDTFQSGLKGNLQRTTRIWGAFSPLETYPSSRNHSTWSVPGRPKKSFCRDQSLIQWVPKSKSKPSRLTSPSAMLRPVELNLSLRYKLHIPDVAGDLWIPTPPQKKNEAFHRHLFHLKICLLGGGRTRRLGPKAGKKPPLPANSPE